MTFLHSALLCKEVSLGWSSGDLCPLLCGQPPLKVESCRRRDQKGNSSSFSGVEDLVFKSDLPAEKNWQKKVREEEGGEGNLAGKTR